MTGDTVSAHIVAAMLGLDAAERAAASRAGWDSVEEWSLAWGGVVTAQRALSAAAGPHLEAQAASLESLEAGDCAEYLRASMWALDTLGPQVDMPGLMVARANIEDVARQVAAIGARESAPSESGGSWRRLTAVLLARGHRSCIGTGAGHIGTCPDPLERQFSARTGASHQLGLVARTEIVADFEPVDPARPQQILEYSQQLQEWQLVANPATKAMAT